MPYSKKSQSDCIHVIVEYRQKNWNRLCKDYEIGPAELSEFELGFFSMEYVSANILNGGFAQAFTNSSGSLVPVVNRWLTRIGATEPGAAFRKAMGTLPWNLDWSDMDAIAVALDNQTEAEYRTLDALSTRWIAELDDQMYLKLGAFMEDHPDLLRNQPF